MQRNFRIAKTKPGRRQTYVAGTVKRALPKQDYSLLSSIFEREENKTSPKQFPKQETLNYQSLANDNDNQEIEEQGTDNKTVTSKPSRKSHHLKPEMHLTHCVNRQNQSYNTLKSRK